MSSLSDFNKEFDKATKLVITGTDNTIKGTTEQLLKSIILSTPVKTGQLRGNWQTTLESPSTHDLTGTTDPSGFKTIEHAVQAVSGYSSAKGNGKIFMANNLDYANEIEYGQKSSQSPYGMVRINVAKFQEIIDSEAKKNEV